MSLTTGNCVVFLVGYVVRCWKYWLPFLSQCRHNFKV